MIPLSPLVRQIVDTFFWEGNLTVLLLSLMFSYWLYFWLCWVFVVRLSLVVSGGGGMGGGATLRCSALASHCSSFLCCGAQRLGHSGFSSCSSWAQQLQVLGSRTTGLIAVVHRLTGPAAGGIFPNQESNPCLLHCKADSLPLSHQESPESSF